MGGGAYLSAEMQSVYSTAPADWATVAYKIYTQWNKETIQNWICLVYKSNRSVCKLLVLERNTWNHLTVCKRIKKPQKM